MMEQGFVSNLPRYRTNYYPFRIFSNRLTKLELHPITLLYGGNGSGKSTLLNIIAEKASVIRHSPFNSSGIFKDYLKLCDLEGSAPGESEILTSDDVFEYLIHMRNLNEGVEDRQKQLYSEYMDYKHASNKFATLADYDKWRKKYNTKKKNESESEFVHKRVMQPIQNHSNGESALAFFTHHISENAVYILDEPENSLSIDSQMDLAKFIIDSARFYNCQYIIATHSPVILATEGAVVYDLDNTPVRIRKWTELENVKSYYKFFMEHSAEFDIAEPDNTHDKLFTLLKRKGLKAMEAYDFIKVIEKEEVALSLIGWLEDLDTRITIQEAYHALAHFISEHK